MLLAAAGTWSLKSCDIQLISWHCCHEIWRINTQKISTSSSSNTYPLSPDNLDVCTVAPPSHCLRPRSCRRRSSRTCRGGWTTCPRPRQSVAIHSRCEWCDPTTSGWPALHLGLQGQQWSCPLCQAECSWHIITQISFQSSYKWRVPDISVPKIINNPSKVDILSQSPSNILSNSWRMTKLAGCPLDTLLVEDLGIPRPRSSVCLARVQYHGTLVWPDLGYLSQSIIPFKRRQTRHLIMHNSSSKYSEKLVKILQIL